MKARTGPTPLTQLQEDEKLFQQEVRRFAKAEIQPLVREMDENAEIPHSLLEQMFNVGMMGIEIPTAENGDGGSFFMSILAIEELARVDPAISVLVHVQNVLVGKSLLHFGNEAQKGRYFPSLAAETVGAYALSEAEAGSDAFAMTTRARREDHCYVLTGRKQWVTSAAEAALFLVFANAEPQLGVRGITAFLLEPSLDGFSIGKREDKLGIRAISTCELILEDVRVPLEKILGKVGTGLDVAGHGLVNGRIGIAAQMVGLAQGALDAAIAYAQQRRQFGRPVVQFQGVHFPLAEVAAEIEAARLLTYNAARLAQARTPHFKLLAPSAMAKLLASQAAERAASLAIETFGGNGFTKDYPVEKFYRDAKIGKIYEGTSNILRRTIAASLMDGLE